MSAKEPDFIERKHAYTVLPDSLIDDETISKQSKLVYMVIARHADKNRTAFPGASLISKKANCGRKQVFQALHELQNRGYLTVQRRLKENGKSLLSNLYTLHDLPSVGNNIEGSFPESLGGSIQEKLGSIQEKLPLVSQGNGKYIHSSNNNKNINDQKKYDAEFDQFWKAYPKHDSKIAAYRCYLKTLKKGVTPADLLTAAGRYAKQINGTEKKFIKLGSTFLGPDEHFRDFLGEPEETAHKTPTFSKCPECGGNLHPDGFCLSCSYEVAR